LIFVFLFQVVEIPAQEDSISKKNSIVACYTEDPSFQAKLIDKTMGMLSMNKKMEKNVRNNSYPKEANKIPKSIVKKFDVKVLHQSGRKVWIIQNKKGKARSTILYLHGGAYNANINSQHWLLIEQLIITSNAKIIVPDYPLAPENNCLDISIYA